MKIGCLRSTAESRQPSATTAPPSSQTQPNCTEIYNNKLHQSEHTWDTETIEGHDTMQQARAIIVRLGSPTTTSGSAGFPLPPLAGTCAKSAAPLFSPTAAGCWRRRRRPRASADTGGEAAAKAAAPTSAAAVSEGCRGSICCGRHLFVCCGRRLSSSPPPRRDHFSRRTSNAPSRSSSLSTPCGGTQCPLVPNEASLGARIISSALPLNPTPHPSSYSKICKHTYDRSGALSMMNTPSGFRCPIVGALARQPP